MNGARREAPPESIDAIVERIGSGPGLHTLTVAEARATSLARRALLRRPRDYVRAVRGVTVPVRGGQLRARLYAPRGGAPVLLYLHGGGWVLGDLESADALCRSLASDSGCAVLSLDYPLAPENRFPAAAEAAHAAAGWLASHGRDIGVRAEGIAVGGDSAGANLAAAVALMARDRGAPDLRFQLLLFPPTDGAAALGAAAAPPVPERSTPLLSREEMDWFWRHYLGRGGDATDPYASPLRADVRGVAPALIVTAELDVLREEGDAYAAKLRAAGVRVEHRCYAGMPHGFLGLAGELSSAADAIRDIAAALRTALVS
ncbi:alpha/beta hydrolase [soil metagenome]